MVLYVFILTFISTDTQANKIEYFNERKLREKNKRIKSQYTIAKVQFDWKCCWDSAGGTEKKGDKKTEIERKSKRKRESGNKSPNSTKRYNQIKLLVI